MDKLVSIITPVYNSQSVLEKTIESVISQTYENWELILVDDFSNDDSREIISKWKNGDDRIKSIYLSSNNGAGNARNVGLELAKGKYIAFLDADDLWMPLKLDQQIKFLQSQRDIHFLYSWYATVDEVGNQINTFKTPSRISFNLLKYNNYILTSTVICSADVVSDVRFSEMRRRQDWGFFLDILRKLDYAYCLPEVTVHYRKISGSLSSNKWKLIMPNFEFFKYQLFRGSSFKAFVHFILFLPFYFHNKVFNKRNIK